MNLTSAHNSGILSKFHINTLLLLITVFWLPNTLAAWTVFGLNGQCPSTYDEMFSFPAKSSFGSSCPFTMGDGNAVPTSGTYSILAIASHNPGGASVEGTYHLARGNSSMQIATGKQLNTISAYFSVNPGIVLETEYSYLCYALQQLGTGLNFLINNSPQACLEVPNPGGELPPGPGFLTCIFNNGSPLNVQLGEVIRSELGALPETLPGTEVNMNVTCTGEGASTYSIRFKYMSVNIAGNEYILSSANGLSVSISLNGVLVNTTEDYTRTYNAGTQTETLRFEPMRDPNVKYTDIPTGAFTASAVMIVTQE
ncbi:fimbrial protein [Enterobacter chuandaensis]|uniref:Fimbrial protein n=1 Tax=Enterobacter chuandaensis TaxID=2497875 RepID=A0AA96M262_9ENTR|nr:fimbrial protein [Enterobacter chuandaensis]MCW4783047.1 fimbrial protein [Enterobacter chuandaensis]MDA4760251.1 fimbrial protein [Enterobacter chuandaensis]WNS37158.1 fimbrial protein [Enterobacter chuandaensis]